MDYQAYWLHEDLSVRQIFTFYYLELPSHFQARGEKHDFWEFVYVDKGELTIRADDEEKNLLPGDMVFYAPNSFHAGCAVRETAPNLVVLTFSCVAGCMDFFRGRIFHLDEQERVLVANLIKEGIQAFSPAIDSPSMTFPARREDAPFGSEQLIRNYLEILLITLIRRINPPASAVQSRTALLLLPGRRSDPELVEQIVSYLRQHTADRLSVSQVCAVFRISRSRLLTLFKTHTDYSLMAYFTRLKIDRGKQMIREGCHTKSQIADLLAYGDLGSFSRQFRRITGMTPSEYERSVKARAE